MINKYETGKVTINGKEFHSDIIICENVIEDNWSRSEVNLISMGDVNQYIDKYQPDIIIIGTGHDESLSLKEDFRIFAEESEINFLMEETSTACAHYNTLSRFNKVLCFLHLN